MTPLVPIVIFGALPAIVLAFLMLPPRRALLVSVVGAALTLPEASYNLPGLPKYTRETAISVGVLLGIIMSDLGRIFEFRLRWVDFPMLIWCLCPMATSLSNGLGAYDGASGIFIQTVSWGLPYFFGRIYLNSPEGQRALGIAIFVGGLAYILPCVFEMRFSPLLGKWLYGTHNIEGMRLGGYRPRVLLGKGLELGMWMTVSALSGIWLWAGGSVRRLRGYPMGWLAAALLVTTVLCRSTGALLLLMIGGPMFWAIKWTGSRLPLIGLIAIAPCYIAIRAPGLWSGSHAIEMAKKLDTERAWSLLWRLRNEDVLARHALRRPWFGWGGFNRNRVYLEDKSYGHFGADIDGYWILTLGVNGMVGLGSGCLVHLLPLIRLTARPRPRRLLDPECAPATMLAIVGGLCMIDNLINYMYNPIYTLALGSLAQLPVPGRAGRGPRGRAPRAAGLPRGPELHPIAGEAAYRRALTQGEAQLAGGPSGPDERRNLAVGYDRFGRWLRQRGRPVEALAASRRALELYATLAQGQGARTEDRARWSDALNNLAWALAHQPGTDAKAEAIDLAERAVALAPGHAGYWNTLGAAYGRHGRWDEARRALERSVELGGGTGFDHFYLALAYAQAGDSAAARHWYDQGVSWASKHAPGHAGLIRLGSEAAEMLAAQVGLPAPGPVA